MPQPIGGIDSQVGDIMAVYGNNSGQLQRKASLSKDLIDLLALQQVKKLQEAKARDIQMQTRVPAGTVAEQTKSAVMNNQLSEIERQLGSMQNMIGRQQQQQQRPPQQAQQPQFTAPQGPPQVGQPQPPGIAGLPAQNMQGMGRASGGLVSFAHSGPVGRDIRENGYYTDELKTQEEIAPIHAGLDRMRETRRRAETGEFSPEELEIQDLQIRLHEAGLRGEVDTEALARLQAIAKSRGYRLPRNIVPPQAAPPQAAPPQVDVGAAIKQLEALGARDKAPAPTQNAPMDITAPETSTSTQPDYGGVRVGAPVDLSAAMETIGNSFSYDNSYTKKLVDVVKEHPEDAITVAALIWATKGHAVRLAIKLYGKLSPAVRKILAKALTKEGTPFLIAGSAQLSKLFGGDDEEAKPETPTEEVIKELDKTAKPEVNLEAIKDAMRSAGITASVTEKPDDTALEQDLVAAAKAKEGATTIPTTGATTGTESVDATSTIDDLKKAGTEGAEESRAARAKAREARAQHSLALIKEKEDQVQDHLFSRKRNWDAIVNRMLAFGGARTFAEGATRSGIAGQQFNREQDKLEREALKEIHDLKRARLDQDLAWAEDEYSEDKAERNASVEYLKVAHSWNVDIANARAQILNSQANMQNAQANMLTANATASYRTKKLKLEQRIQDSLEDMNTYAQGNKKIELALEAIKSLNDYDAFLADSVKFGSKEDKAAAKSVVVQYYNRMRLLLEAVLAGDTTRAFAGLNRRQPETPDKNAGGIVTLGSRAQAGG